MAVFSKRSFFGGVAVGCVAAFLVPIFLIAGASLVAMYVPALNAMVLETATKRLQAPALPQSERVEYSGALLDSEDREVPLETFEGRVALFHFWQPECTSCLAELPAIRALHHELEARGLPVVVVSVAVGDTKELPEIIEKYGLSYPIYRLPGAIPPPFNTEHTPATYIVNQNGEVLVKRTGNAKWDDPSVLDFLERITLGDVQAP